MREQTQSGQASCRKWRAFRPRGSARPPFPSSRPHLADDRGRSPLSSISQPPIHPPPPTIPSLSLFLRYARPLPVSMTQSESDERIRSPILPLPFAFGASRSFVREIGLVFSEMEPRFGTELMTAYYEKGTLQGDFPKEKRGKQRKMRLVTSGPFYSWECKGNLSLEDLSVCQTRTFWEVGIVQW